MKCSAIIVFGNDRRDGRTTFHCQLTLGHSGAHQECGDMGYNIVSVCYTLTWQGDSSDIDKTLEALVTSA